MYHTKYSYVIKRFKRLAGRKEDSEWKILKMRNKQRNHKKETLQRLAEKYGISEEDLQELEEENDLLTDGLILLIFALAIVPMIARFIC